MCVYIKTYTCILEHITKVLLLVLKVVLLNIFSSQVEFRYLIHTANEKETCYSELLYVYAVVTSISEKKNK